MLIAIAIGKDNFTTTGTAYTATSGSSLHRPSPASSIGTSGSSNGSAYSHASQHSDNSLARLGRQRNKRKKRALRNRSSGAGAGGGAAGDGRTSLQTPMNTFQCTFCTETFKTKHIWQRHEKSLHLPLERWLCAPEGPMVTSKDGVVACAFCGHVNPNNAHMETHNYAACKERSVEERTFHRKDHLGQHLRLVHNVDPTQPCGLLDLWKIETPSIRSRCGFCSLTMDTWATRAEHLAEHFKMGANMADWEGDWGFDPEILALVTYAIEPCKCLGMRHWSCLTSFLRVCRHDCL